MTRVTDAGLWNLESSHSNPTPYKTAVHLTVRLHSGRLTPANTSVLIETLVISLLHPQMPESLLRTDMSSAIKR